MKTWTICPKATLHNRIEKFSDPVLVIKTTKVRIATFSVDGLFRSQTWGHTFLRSGRRISSQKSRVWLEVSPSVRVQGVGFGF